MTEWLRFEGTLKNIQFQSPCHGHGCHLLDTEILFNAWQRLNCTFPTQKALTKQLMRPDEHFSSAEGGCHLTTLLPAPRHPGWVTQSSSPHLCIQLHDVSYFVPAKSNKPSVILWAVLPHDDVWLEVCFPLHAVRGGGCSPFGKVGWRMPFCPDVIP